jgi:hypothetical protein
MKWFGWLRRKSKEPEIEDTPDAWAERMSVYMKLLTTGGEGVTAGGVSEMESDVKSTGTMIRQMHGPQFQKAVLDRVALESSKYAALLAKLWGISSAPQRVVVDLRPTQARQAATAATSNLGADEEIAKRLVSLVGQITAASWTRSVLEQDEAYRKVREIGEQINNNGGFSRMQRVGYRVKALGGKARLLEISWGGIGEWRE